MNEQVKRMAELLRSGATMLQETCPNCNSPLFKFEGRVFCAKCGSPSPTVAKAPRMVNLEAMISELTSTILSKLEKLNDKVNKTSRPNDLYKLAKTILTLLKALDHLEKLKAR